MTKSLKNTIGTICGALACVSVFAAVSVTDGSAYEMAVSCGGAIGFAIFALLWDKLKENN